VLRKQVRRGQFLAFAAKLAPTEIGLEACGASHHWARQLRALGHEVVLLPPQHVKPYVGPEEHEKDAPRERQPPALKVLAQQP
jgi:transposase